MKARRLRVAPGMTLKEWGELPDDVYAELVDGVLVDDEMTTLAHDVLAMYLAAFFERWVDPRGGIVVCERKFGVSRTTGRKPDVSVFLANTKALSASARVTMSPPDIAIEVVTSTPRDIRRDRIEKRREYARFGIRWYWIVDPSLRSVEILGLGARGRYEHVGDGSTGKLRVPGCRGLVLDLDKLWQRQERLAK
jgi:Uma2 family endonuclease